MKFLPIISQMKKYLMSHQMSPSRETFKKERPKVAKSYQRVLISVRHSPTLKRQQIKRIDAHTWEHQRQESSHDLPLNIEIEEILWSSISSWESPNHLKCYAISDLILHGKKRELSLKMKYWGVIKLLQEIYLNWARSSENASPYRASV